MNARLRAGMLIAGVVALDRVTKLYIRTRVSPVDVYPVIPRFFNIVHTENPGAAFGMFSDSPTEWRGILLVGISMAVMTILGMMLWRTAAAQSQVISCSCYSVRMNFRRSTWPTVRSPSARDCW